jgi:hypothetical protein
MSRRSRLFSLVVVGIAAGFFTLYLTNFYLTSINDATARATFLAAVITLYGVIFSATYKEISAYYQEITTSIDRKWKLIFPFIRKHYNKWINAAKSLASALGGLNPEALSDVAVTHVLFLIMLFFGYRLRFIAQDGGLVLLATEKEEEKVDEAYRQVERKSLWAGKDETARLGSYLQYLFVTKDKPEDPYVFHRFADDLGKNPEIRNCPKILQSWLTKENIDGLKGATEGFVECFKNSLAKLYTAWGD